MNLDADEYIETNPYPTSYLNTLENILLNGINDEVTASSHLASYGEIRADYQIVNQMIPDTNYSEAIGNQHIIDSGKSEFINVPTSLFCNAKPSDFHRVVMPEMDFIENRKVRKITISESSKICDIQYEGVPSE